MTPRSGRSKAGPVAFVLSRFLSENRFPLFRKRSRTVFLSMSDDIEVRRRRAAWRAGHRGTKELDLLVGRFAVERLPNMSGADLDRFERFLAENDPKIQGWLLGPLPPSDATGEFAGLVADIRRFHGLA